MRKFLLFIPFLLLFSLRGFSQIEIRELYNFPDTIVVDDTASFGIIVEYTGGTSFYDSIAIRFAVGTDTAIFPMNTQFFPVDTLRPINPVDTLNSTDFIFTNALFTPGPDIVIIWPETRSGKTGSSKTRTIEIVKSDGIEDLILEDGKITLYPVPFKDELNIFSKTALKKIKIFDASGKIVFEEESVTTLNTSLWRAGIYFIEIVDREGVIYREKVMKY